MGILLNLHCPDCGFEKPHLRFGMTFMDPRDMGPALDVKNATIVEIDYGAHSNMDIVPYTETHLRKAPKGIKKVPLHKSHPYKLWQHYNFCPGCNGYTLSMTITAFID